MNNGIDPRGLLNAIRKLLPGSTLAIVSETPWYSLTFAGMRIGVLVTLSPPDSHVADRFASELPDHEFSLPGLLVADISATLEATDDATNRLVIDALLLQD